MAAILHRVLRALVRTRFAPIDAGAILFVQKSDQSTDVAMTLAHGDGDPEDQYLVGNWDGTGSAVALRRGNKIIFRNQLGPIENGVRRESIFFGNGNEEDEYLVGDWNGIGRDDIAIRRGPTIIFRNPSSSPGAPGSMGPNFGRGILDTFVFGDGNAEDEYLVGDWNGTGKDIVAIRRGGRIIFPSPHNVASPIPFPLGPDEGNGPLDHADFGNGNEEDEYLVGKFDGGKRDLLAVRRGDKIICRLPGGGTKDFFFGLF